MLYYLSVAVDKRDPGRVYMPDMAYSRAYEAYAPNNLKAGKHKLYYIIR
ncbi:MAG: hypothetical protein WKF59_16315 [Chitinophagaceae bacterium]